ncbi:MAG: TIGR04282 family arsenosugar biosynthesis glycosyltransferase [Thermoanaerobaculia bacterium]|nr:TIGR04282 family arsenosugar biosynthesis glycosyltransferase [Thermoanaerobaculia bacterium]
MLFAREPVPGLVKTRLAREIGAAAATSLYQAFLTDLAACLTSPARWDAVLAYAEFEPGPALLAIFRPPWDLVPQGEGSLGERLARAVVRARMEGRRDVLVAGSDAPTLTSEDLSEGFAALAENWDVVYAPAPDGGFSLVGMRGSVDPAAVFPAGVRWSSPHALADSRRSAESKGYRVRLISTVPDIDEIADLWSVEALFGSDPDLAPATRRALSTLLGRSAV